MPSASSLHELTTLIRSYHSIVAVESSEEERISELCEAAGKSLGISYFEWSVAQGLRYGGSSGGAAIATTQEPEGVLRHLQAIDRDGLFLLKDFSPFLEDHTVARLLREVCQEFAGKRSTVILSGSSVEIPREIEQYSAFLRLRLPGKRELRAVMRSVWETLSTYNSVRFDLRDADAERMIDALRGMTLNQARQAIAYAAIHDGELNADDIASVIDRKAHFIRDSGLLEYLPPGDNAFELGGFAGLQGWLERARHGFGEQARKLNLSPPRGILMVGVQGCGKSLAAKSIARAWQQPLLKLDAGRLYDKYVGESEKNLRRAFALAESMAPCVLWIDELEKAFGSTGDGEQDGGLSRRVQGSLLTWLQEKREAVFVVATANDVFSLPPELIRRGRFDEIFFVDLPNPVERRAIFGIHLRLRNQDPGRFDLPTLVMASEGMSGAEIEQAVIASLYRSLHDATDLGDAQILRELDATIPLSVSRREDIAKLRGMAERFLPVGEPR